MRSRAIKLHNDRMGDKVLQRFRKQSNTFIRTALFENWNGITSKTELTSIRPLQKLSTPGDRRRSRRYLRSRTFWYNGAKSELDIWKRRLRDRCNFSCRNEKVDEYSLDLERLEFDWETSSNMNLSFFNLIRGNNQSNFIFVFSFLRIFFSFLFRFVTHK